MSNLLSNLYLGVIFISLSCKYHTDKKNNFYRLLSELNPNLFQLIKDELIRPKLDLVLIYKFLYYFINFYIFFQVHQIVSRINFLETRL